MIIRFALFRLLWIASGLGICIIVLGVLNLGAYRRACELFLAFVVIACIASFLRGRTRDGSMVLCSLILGLAAIETFAVGMEKTSLPIQGKGFSVSRPVLGRGPTHSGQFPARKVDRETGRIIYDVTYTIDDMLLRQTFSRESGPTIVFFGDSMTFGEGVGDPETMPQAFADLTGRRLRVLNLGFPGFGPHHFLRELETGLFDTAIGPQPRLFMFMTAAWHAERSTCKSAWTLSDPRYALTAGAIGFKGACNEGLSFHLRQWFESMASYRLALAPYRQKVGRDDIELYIAVLLEAVRVAKTKYGVATIIPYLRQIPPSYVLWTGLDDDSIIERLKDGGAIVVDVTLAEERAGGAPLEIPGDGHPTPLAHRLRARLLEAYVAQHMPGLVASK